MPSSSSSLSKTVLLSLTLLFFSTTSSTLDHHPRRILHHPILPGSSSPPTQPPSSPPKPQPKHPFSSTPTTSSAGNPFFPTYPIPPPPPKTTPTTSTNALPTFPANISSLALPRSSGSTSHSSVSTKLIVISVLLSVLVVSIFAALAVVLIHRKRRSRRGHHPEDPSSSDDVRLYPSRVAASDGHQIPKLEANTAAGVSGTSSEFLYLGTLATSREFEKKGDKVSDGVHHEHGETTGLSNRHHVESPEIRPLPPLPKQSFHSRDFEVGFRDFVEDDEEEFYSPKGSSDRMGLSSKKEFEAVNSENKSSSNSMYHDSNSSSPLHSATCSPSPLLNCQKSDQPEFIDRSPSIRTLTPDNHHLPSPGRNSSHSTSDRDSPARSSDSSSEASVEIQPFNGKQSRSGKSVLQVHQPPPSPPPPPPPRYWENGILGPPPHVPPSGPIVFQSSASMREQASSSADINSSNNNNNETLPKPKLKALHWDKVRASSEKATVWDRLKPSSFQLNEEMIETLFVVNGPNSGSKETGASGRSMMPLLNPETRVLDPKKSQNVAILLRALNVTVEEVCDALLEGNVDTLGTELLESLLKMAPTKEEERKLKEYKDESPLKLGSAEKFLKAVLDIPFAFRRVDAMLYVANFDSEVEYLRKSFDALEAACEELRKSRMFLKLLETVLKTGNRMNVGTNRGDAQAFKLDTLLKLVDVKGADGKTTLLHFVVQEVIRSEGSRLQRTSTHDTMPAKPSITLHEDIDSRKRGLEVVAGLGAELSNVKKAAAMDSDVLSNDVRKLAKGISKVLEVVKLNKEEADGLKKELSNDGKKFSETMNGFLKKAEVEISKIQGQENTAFSKVKELTEYFHGNLAKEEAHPLRIFMVVRDFLRALDQVCKEVGKVNERSVYQFSHPVNPSPHPVFPKLKEKQQSHGGSDNDESASPS